MDLDNKTIFSFKKRAETYDKKMNWVNDDELILPLVSKPFGNNRTLEICAGTGIVSKMLKKNGWNVVMLDSSQEMLQRSEEKNYIIGDMHELPFDDNSFQMVVCRQGLQYANLEKVFQEVYRVSKKEFRIGHITKLESDKSDFWEKYFEVASPGRKHIFSPGDLEKVAEEWHFRVKSIEVITKQDNYLGPIMYLSNEMKKYLIDLLINTSIDFKEIYNVKIIDDIITYSNRWEFIIFEKQ